MKNLKEYNTSALICYLYIIIIFLSFAVRREGKLLYILFTLTGGIISIGILLDLKKLFNKKFLFKGVDYFIYIFIFIKIIFLLGDILLEEKFLEILQKDKHYIFPLIGILQCIYSYIIMTKDFKGIKGLKGYAILNLLAGAITIFRGINAFQILVTVINMYLLADIFFQSEELVDKEK
ncbi:hypothetical protein [Cetobacterium ceti]